MLQPRRLAKASIALLALISIAPTDAFAVTCYKIHDRAGRLIYRSPEPPINIAGNMSAQMRDRWGGGKVTYMESPFCEPLEDTSATVASRPITTTSPVVLPSAPTGAAQQPSPPGAVHSAAGPSDVNDPPRSDPAPRNAPVIGGSGAGSGYAVLPAQPAPPPDTKQAGGQLAAEVRVGDKKNRTQAEVSALPHGADPGESNSMGGFTDPSPTLGLAWTIGAHTWTTNFTGATPLGSYDNKQLSNKGVGHGMIDAGYTYLDQENGREFSVTMGATYNFENTNTIYRTGIDSHLDWTMSQLLFARWKAGVGGYVNYQLSGDNRVAAPGPFKSKVASIGPQLGYMFTIAGLPAYANVRGFWEFWSSDGLHGYGVNATVEIPLGLQK